MSKRRPTYYNVKPRFSPGSPAQVDFDTATKVVDDERTGYNHVMLGIYGPEQVAAAEAAGLSGIVEERVEHTDHWFVTDMITSAQFIRMFPVRETDPKVTARKKFALERKNPGVKVIPFA